MNIKKALALYSLAAMITVVICAILWVDKTFNIEPKTAASALALATPVVILTILVLRERSGNL